MRYVGGVGTIAEQLAGFSTMNHVAVPDIWQQEAVAALRGGKDVVVQAPTGAGKTLVFELWSKQGKPRGQAIYTVPTRALANDKLAEWRSRGWEVGIATGDLAEKLDAPILVATLETQKNRLIEGRGPALLVVDEYQMLGDTDRGLNYELAIALAPAETQLLLLSGSVANPQDMVKWLQRLGRQSVLIRHDVRPVPLEEVFATHLSYAVPNQIKGYWPRLVAKALAEDLGPILIFAPRRQAAETIASEIARQLPVPAHPLTLRHDQKQIVGESLAKLLRGRVAYHHSGLSYAARAGVIEPLAKAGQLRVVVATMGLAAGINFSLRSTALAGESYRRDFAEQLLQPDEILQMFGRAGRRGIDETGYALISANEIRLRDGYPAHLSRSGMVDWGALLGVMQAAHVHGRAPFPEAVRVQERLFSSKPIVLGVEESLKHPRVPCGLGTDAERARHVRKRLREMLNSRGEWELMPNPTERSLRDIWVMDPLSASESTVPTGEASPAPVPEIHMPGGDGETGTPDSAQPGTIIPLPVAGDVGDGHPTSRKTPALRPVLTEAEALEKVGTGILSILGEHEGRPIYGRLFTVAEVLHEGTYLLVKWIRRMTRWGGRQASPEIWLEKVVPMIEQKLAQNKTPVVRFETRPQKIVALVSLADLSMRVPVDSYGVALWRPITREVFPPDCARCALVPVCQQLSPAPGTALMWRRLGLVDANGAPTRRGRIVSFFSQGYGLGLAAAMEDETYPLDEMIYDVANMDAGFRFCGDENRWAGRIPMACHRIYGLQSVPGYLENGLPPRYGAGAEQIVAAVHKNPASKNTWANEFLGVGDIDRMIIEWRSILRQIANAPKLEWPRWVAFQAMAKGILQETESPTATELPELDYTQTRRVDHRLILRRH